MTTINSSLPLPCGAVLPNRLAKAAMSERLADRNGMPGDGMVRLYDVWGRGGVGLNITGHVIIDHRHIAEPGNVIVEDGRHIEALAKVAAAAKSNGAHIWAQLNHPGRQTARFVDKAPVAPSAVALKIGAGSFARPRALENAEIRELIGRFADSAAAFEAAGFDGVEIHGAHGYLVSQFLSPLTNLRDDEWGGDSARRRRFLIEIVRAVRARIGSRFAVGVKLNSADFQRGGFEQDDAFDVISALSDEGVDLLEVSGGTYERAAMFDDDIRQSTRAREAFFLDFAERARAYARVPLMLTGGFRSRAAMDGALASSAVDVVGMARPLVAEPDLAARLLSGESAAAREIDITTGIRTLDAALQGAWYQQQIARLADGAAPDLALGRFRALLGLVRGMSGNKHTGSRPGVGA
jgi:2,4-dienoyl-CoA reductase-like NADH-dependent reductase (Old Yellow Enzyme family)